MPYVLELDKVCLSVGTSATDVTLAVGRSFCKGPSENLTNLTDEIHQALLADLSSLTVFSSSRVN